uniref:Uncharacterized protein n=1 Tax=Rhizophora mucronata TaxID=61149 RepID=A0A2P2KKC4_RHIMU
MRQQNLFHFRSHMTKFKRYYRSVCSLLTHMHTHRKFGVLLI